MDFIALNLKVESDFSEILIAELAEIGFSSFIENEEGLEAYIEEDIFSKTLLDEVINQYSTRTTVSYTLEKIEKQNWNKEWEENFQPINVVDQVYIRANFHAPAPDSYSYEIIILPKMSFGTGHHETTAQMIALQLEIDHHGKSVLDVGTGTGILAIMAHKLGASTLHSFDIDEWSVENGKENFSLNHINNISIEQGTITTQLPKQYDIVLANINRNILLDEIPIYSKFSKDYLLVSGFYEQDLSDICLVAEKSGFKKVKHISKNNWAAVVFRK